jgi:hypothetical protein
MAKKTAIKLEVYPALRNNKEYFCLDPQKAHQKGYSYNSKVPKRAKKQKLVLSNKPRLIHGTSLDLRTILQIS